LALSVAIMTILTGVIKVDTESSNELIVSYSV
jgi:hypothetical protein